MSASRPEPGPDPLPEPVGAFLTAASASHNTEVLLPTLPEVSPHRTNAAGPSRTKSNKTEQESAPIPTQDGSSAATDQNSPPPSVQQAIDDIDRQLESVLSDRDWLNDFPSHNPEHPERQQALQLVAKRQTLLAQLAATPENPPAA